MTPETFITKWRAADLKERSAAQEHFIDLCRLLQEPTPAEADPTGESYSFERGATKTSGARGWADVWKRGCFGWEYKGRGRDLTAAFAQLQQYALALENPPLLVVCDLQRIVVRTNWTNTVSETREIGLEDLRDAAVRQTLKDVMSDPERLRPGVTRTALTERAAGEFAIVAGRLRERGHEAKDVAHFVNRLVFCMFAEDVGLLPNQMFSRMLGAAAKSPARFESLASTLFSAMHSGAMVGFEPVEWFNGGLFDDGQALPLDAEDLAIVRRAAALDWSDIDPSILGTLFERGLDPGKRAQLGAHYTDRDKIMRIVEPVLVRPWLERWGHAKGRIAEVLGRAAAARSPAARERGRREAQRLYFSHVEALRRFRVLDPACGSGNFLYLALLALKDLEHGAGLDAEALGLQREFPGVGPESVLGIEINPYAAELARVTVWIGEIQWMRRNGFDVSRDPILKPLRTIECRDALLSEDGEVARWPDADVVVGNPPFLGARRLRSTLGDAYVDRLFSAYREHVPGGADLVAYWIVKAADLVTLGRVERAGLVTTNSIRGEANRPVLTIVADRRLIFEAWSDEPWVVDGAAVRVSLLCFGDEPSKAPNLDGVPVAVINADLSSSGVDLLRAGRLRENAGVAFQGPVKIGPFEVPGALAREWLVASGNPNGRPNSDVVRPWANGADLVRRPSDTWIIDFAEMREEDAAQYEAPFEHVRRHVKPLRDANRRERRRDFWWQHGETVPGLRRAMTGLARYVATPRVSRHRLFVWLDAAVLPDSRLVAVCRSDDQTFGILHSRFHEAWSLARGGWHGVGNDPQYTPSAGFETFPFPEGMAPGQPLGLTSAAADVGAAAARLDALRREWLNPSDLVLVEPEVVPGLPNRLVARSEAAAEALRRRTLTALYNERPSWLEHAHRSLDAAVAAAYGWSPAIATQDALGQLLSLNAARAHNAARTSFEGQFERALRAQSDEAATAMLSRGRSITYREHDTPEGHVVREEPDGSRTIVRVDLPARSSAT